MIEQITNYDNWVGDICFEDGVPRSYLDNPLPYWRDYVEDEYLSHCVLDDRWDAIQDAVMELLLKIYPDDLALSGCDADIAQEYVSDCKQLETCLQLIIAINDLNPEKVLDYVWEKLPYEKEIERMRHGH